MVIIHILPNSQISVAGTPENMAHAIDGGLTAVTFPKTSGILDVVHVVHLDILGHGGSFLEYMSGIIHCQVCQVGFQFTTFPYHFTVSQFRRFLHFFSEICLIIFFDGFLHFLLPLGFGKSLFEYIW